MSIQAQYPNLNIALNQLKVTPLDHFSGFTNITISLARVVIPGSDA